VRSRLPLIAPVLVLSILTAFGGAWASGAGVVHRTPAESDVFEKNSTQAVCALTGEHGAYTERPLRYTSSDDGFVAGDAGSSFVFDDKVWWLFGNSNAAVSLPWGSTNSSSRWPSVLGPPFNAVELGSDAMATSSLSAHPPSPRAPYNDKVMPPNEQCPSLDFVRKSDLPPSPFVNPSVYPDPMFKSPYFVSLRTGELPETGIGYGSNMYVVFGTDNPANCEALVAVGPCTDPSPPGSTTTCSGTQGGSRTRSLMAVYDGSEGRFRGLYDLSTPLDRFAPTCPVSAKDDIARFVNVQMARDGNELYLWGTEGGANNDQSPVYLARMPIKDIATGANLAYWTSDGGAAHFAVGPQSLATPIFTDSPDPCAAQLGIQHNVFLDKWIVLYHCKEPVLIKGRPNGIYMRTAANPWGPWSAPTTIFNPAADPRTKSGYCFFIYSTQTESTKNPTGSSVCEPSWPNASLADSAMHVGNYYGPYFVANWVTGVTATRTRAASTTIYYTLDTFDPYGQLVMRSTITGPPPEAKL
jgi:Domain of unknown function (DUF4185)